MREAENQAWDMAENFATDPGLRDTYESLPRAPITLIALPLVKDVNQGGLLRVGEAFRIAQVDLSPEADGAIDCSAHRGTKRRQPHRWIESSQAIREAKEAGKYVVAVTLSDRAIDLDRFEWRFPLALVLGRENDGVSEEIESMCDASVAIPLFGIVQSLNVATAAGIVLNEATREYTRRDPDFLPARRASQELLQR
jgi:tRNA (guanosine-2'-O-)-methyltransferase